MTDTITTAGPLQFVVGAVAAICREHPDWTAEQVARAFVPARKAPV